MTTLSNAQKIELKSFCDDNEYDFRENYSGRGMYGKSCIGFVSSDHPFNVAMKLVAYLRFEMGSDCELIDVFTNAGSCSDSMGRREIIYFPSIRIEEQDEVSDGN